MVEVSPEQIVNIIGRISSAKSMIQDKLATIRGDSERQAAIYAEIRPEIERAAALLYTVTSRNGYAVPNRALNDAEINERLS